jgi:hypothetical protein
MDAAITLKTGKKTVNIKQCDSRGRISIVQDVPFPAEVLNILGRVAIGDEPKYAVEMEDLPAFFLNCGSPIPTECIDSTRRGQQVLITEVVFSNQDSVPGAPAIVHSAYGLFVTPAGEYYSMSGDANCAGGNMAYVDGCVVVSHFTNFNETVFDHPALVPPQNVLLPAVNVMNGPSDEPMYCFNNGGSVDAYYIEDNFHVQFTEIPPGSLNPRHFAKRQNRIYFNPSQSFGNVPHRNIYVFQDRTNTLVAQWSTLDTFFFDSFYPTNNFLYVLAFNLTFTTAAVKKLDLSDGSLAGSFDISGISPNGIYPVSDDLIYILTQHGNGELYYLDNFTNLIYVGKIHNPETVDTSFSSMIFSDGRLYYGGNGRNIDVSSKIKSFVVDCPDTAAQVASVARLQGAVADGTDLDVSWTGILEPDSTDRIGLYADVPGELGFNPISSLAFISTGGLAAGAGILTIPLGTAAGNYFVALTTSLGSAFIAKSPIFGVT